MANPRIGIIGSGNIGSGLARLAVTAGLEVRMGNSRGPVSLARLVQELGPNARADSVDGVAEHADIVVLALPLTAYRTLPVEQLAGKVVVDAMNYYPRYTGTIQEIEASGTFSSLLVQQYLARASVVKGFNNVDFIRLVRSSNPSGSPLRSALPIAGDDGGAKSRVAEFMDIVGFDSFDVGGLLEGRRFQPETPLYVAPYVRDLQNPSDDPVTRFMEAETVVVSREDVRRLAAQVVLG